MTTDFSAKSYFSCHLPQNWHRRPRQLTPQQKEIFNAAMKMVRNGTSVKRAIAWIKSEIGKEVL